MVGKRHYSCSLKAYILEREANNWTDIYDKLRRYIRKLEKMFYVFKFPVY